MNKCAKAILACLSAFSSVLAFAPEAAAQSSVTISNFRVQTNGNCGFSGSSTTFLANATGPTGAQDAVEQPSGIGVDFIAFYLLDGADVILGSAGFNAPANSDLANDFFGTTVIPPTVAGNFSFVVHDIDTITPDQAIGATYASNGRQMGRASFNSGALDPDCINPFDTTPPMPVITDLASVVGTASDSVTIDFGEEVTGFALSDLSLTNLSASNLIDRTAGVYTFDVAATGTGTGRISLPANTAADTAGNGNLAAAEVTTSATIEPVQINFANTTAGAGVNEYVVTFVLDDALGGVNILGTIQATNFTITGTNQTPVTSSTFFLNVTGTASGGPVDFTFPANVLQSVSTGNGNALTGPIRAADIDLTPPQPVITYTNYDRVDPFTATIDFGEPVTGFVPLDVTESFAQVTNFTDIGGGVFTMTVMGFDLLTPPEISVAANVAQDLGGNNNLASIGGAIPPPDGSAPTVSITGVPDGFTGPGTHTVTFDWGEGVVDFTDADVAATGGTLGALMPVGTAQQVWTAEFTIVGTEDVSISIPDNAVLDGSGMGSVAAMVSGRFASENVAEELIRDFLGARGQALIAAQPSLSGLLDNDGPSGNIQVTRGQGIVQIQTGTEGPIWAALDSNWSDIDGFETAYTNLTFGSHMYLQDETLLGVMVQFDHAASTEGVAEIEGTGWLIGPYYVARYGSVVVDARVLWGQTENEISPLGTYTDRFGTERVLAMLNLSGEIELDRAILRPLLGWAYTEDRSEAYVDALSNPVAAQRVRLSELEAGVDWVMPLGSAAIDFTGGVSAIFTSEEGGNDDLEGGRGRIDLGLRSTGSGPITFDLGVYADGLLRENQERYGANVSVDWRF